MCRDQQKFASIQSLLENLLLLRFLRLWSSVFLSLSCQHTCCDYPHGLAFEPLGSSPHTIVSLHCYPRTMSATLCTYLSVRSTEQPQCFPTQGWQTPGSQAHGGLRPTVTQTRQYTPSDVPDPTGAGGWSCLLKETHEQTLCDVLVCASDSQVCGVGVYRAGQRLLMFTVQLLSCWGISL